MPERLECEVLQKARYINTLTFTFTFYLLTHLLAAASINVVHYKCTDSSSYYLLTY